MLKEGYTIKDACFGVGISRSRYYEVICKKYKHDIEVKSSKVKSFKESDLIILERIKSIKTEHPFCMFRRVHAWLVHREGIKINIKRVYRLMKGEDLLVARKFYRSKRKPTRNKPRAEKPLQYWGIDMTRFIIAPHGWAYLVIVIDWYTKEIVGYNISLRSKTQEWLKALNMALNKKFKYGVRGKGLKIISDNGSQPTSRYFMKELSNLDIVHIFTSYDNPRGNAETERMMRTIKEEVIWLHEFASLLEAKEVIGEWIEKYNREYVHSSLDYLSPVEFEEKYYQEYKEVA